MLQTNNVNAPRTTKKIHSRRNQFNPLIMILIMAIMRTMSTQKPQTESKYALSHTVKQSHPARPFTAKGTPALHLPIEWGIIDDASCLSFSCVHLEKGDLTDE
jgi:hypothetical protein